MYALLPQLLSLVYNLQCAALPSISESSGIMACRYGIDWFGGIRCGVVTHKAISSSLLAGFINNIIC